MYVKVFIGSLALGCAALLSAQRHPVSVDPADSQGSQAQSPDSAPQSSSAVIVDTKGHFVGVPLGEVEAMRPMASGEWAMFAVGRRGPFLDEYQNIYYASNDCSGTAYLFDNSGQSFNGVAPFAVLALDRIFVTTPDEATSVDVGSAQAFNSVGVPQPCEAVSIGRQLVSPMRVETLPVALVPPFRVTSR